MQWLLMLVPRLLGLVGRLFGLLRSTKFGTWLMAAFALHAGSALVKLLKFAGIAVVSSKVAAPALLDYIVAPLIGLPADWQAFLKMAKVDECIAVMVTAIVLTLSERVSMRKRQYANEVPL